MQRLLLILLLLVASVPVLAQSQGTRSVTAYRLRGAATTPPATCRAAAPVDVWYNTAADVLSVCSAANTWSQLATAASGATVTTSSAVIADNAVVRGDGGARGVQSSLVTIDDAGLLTAPSSSLGAASATSVTTGAGSAAAPSLNFTGHTNGGLYADSATLFFAAGGARIGYINNGELAIDGTQIQIDADGGAVRLRSKAASNLALGATDAAALVAQTLSVQNVVTGTLNTAGANFTIAGSQGTGTGAGGSLIFQTAPAGGSGTAVNVLQTALTIDSTKNATFAGVVSVPAGTSAAPTLAISGAGGWFNSNSGFMASSNPIAIGSGSNVLFAVNQSGDHSVQLLSDGLLKWNSNSSNLLEGSTDTTISRNAAGVVQVGTTAANASGSLLAASLTAPNLYGGSAANDDITIEGTSHATKTTSYVILQPTAGNVGIGTTTLDTWDSAYAVIYMGRDATIAGERIGAATNSLVLSQNAHYNGTSWKYIQTNEASSYYQADGTHNWRYAASGTAGNNITWSTALTILNSGNVGIGDSTPAALFTVGNGDLFQVSSAGAVIIGAGTSITKHLSATATLDFGNVASAGCSDLTITVTGAAVGDSVALGVPNASVVANSSFSAWISATNTATVRFCALISGDPASGIFRVDAWQH